MKEANRVYNTVEFYGNGRTIHKGIKFDLTDYFIDNDLNCGPRLKWVLAQNIFWSVNNKFFAALGKRPGIFMRQIVMNLMFPW